MPAVDWHRYGHTGPEDFGLSVFSPGPGSFLFELSGMKEAAN